MCVSLCVCACGRLGSLFFCLPRFRPYLGFNPKLKRPLTAAAAADVAPSTSPPTTTPTPTRQLEQANFQAAKAGVRSGQVWSGSQVLRARNRAAATPTYPLARQRQRRRVQADGQGKRPRNDTLLGFDQGKGREGRSNPGQTADAPTASGQDRSVEGTRFVAPSVPSLAVDTTTTAAATAAAPALSRRLPPNNQPTERISATSRRATVRFRLEAPKQATGSEVDFRNAEGCLKE